MRPLASDYTGIATTQSRLGQMPVVALAYAQFLYANWSNSYKNVCVKTDSQGKPALAQYPSRCQAILRRLLIWPRWAPGKPSSSLITVVTNSLGSSNRALSCTHPWHSSHPLHGFYSCSSPRVSSFSCTSVAPMTPNDLAADEVMPWRIFWATSSMISGCSLRNALAFSRPWPSRISPYV